MSIKYYFTGKPCKNGHIDKRYLNTGICYACKRERNKRDYNKHTKRALVICHRSYLNNRERCLKGSQLWSENNRQKSNEIKKNYKIRHRDKYLESERNREKEKRKDPLYRTNKAISKQIWNFMKTKKAKRHWETILGYSFEDLKKHLSSNFSKEMTWDNYGTFWEIDHIKPISWFTKSATDSNIKKIWAISNLQPLPIHTNRSKSNRYEG